MHTLQLFSSYGIVNSVSVYDCYKRLPWTIYQEDDERTTVKELYNNLASIPNSEDLAGHSVDGKFQRFPGDSSKY